MLYYLLAHIVSLTVFYILTKVDVWLYSKAILIRKRPLYKNYIFSGYIEYYKALKDSKNGNL